MIPHLMTLHPSLEDKTADDSVSAEMAVELAVESSLNQAQLSCYKGDWPQVIAACEKVIAYSRQSIDSTANHLALGFTDTALPPFANSAVADPTAAEPTAAELYRAKGDLFDAQGQIEAAIKAYEQALGTEPQQVKLGVELRVELRVELGIKLAALYARQQQWEGAIAQYHQALTLDPRLSEARIQLGEAYVQKAQSLRQTGNIAGAVRAYLQALQQQPRLFVAYSRLRYNLMRYDIPKGDPLFQEIATLCQSIVQQQPDLLPARVALGYALTQLGNKAEAINCFEEVGDRMSERQLSVQSSPTLSATSYSTPSAQRSLPTNPQVPNNKRRAPNFIIIGAEKCGTTSLYQYLRQHPAVLPPIEKEIDFFDMEYEQGLDWYLAHFPAMPAESGWLTGETSANYLYSDKAPERIFKHFPHIKLAVILRHPIDRTLSRYSMMVRNGAEKRSFEEAVTQEIALIKQAQSKAGEEIPWPVLNSCRHVGNSLYYHHLKRWLAVFPREQLLVLRSEALFCDPANTLHQLYESLGLSHYLEQTYSKYNVGHYDPVETGIRKTLVDFFAPHTQQLESLLGQSFGWNNAPLKNNHDAH